MEQFSACALTQFYIIYKFVCLKESIQIHKIGHNMEILETASCVYIYIYIIKNNKF